MLRREWAGLKEVTEVKQGSYEGLKEAGRSMEMRRCQRTRSLSPHIHRAVLKHREKMELDLLGKQLT